MLWHERLYIEVGRLVKEKYGGIIIACKDKTSLCHENGFPDSSNIGSTA